jgi:hypothetical protein
MTSAMARSSGMRRAYNEVSERVDVDRYRCLLQAAEASKEAILFERILERM